jgi:hypothetical protein
LVQKIDAACETQKTTKELIELFDSFKIGERLEEDDSSPEDNIPLSQLATQTNAVGNPALMKNQRQARLQMSQSGAPTGLANKAQGRSRKKENNAQKKATAKRAHGRP